MGHLQAQEMSRLTDLETGLTWHLQHNHYPPVHLDFLPVAVSAIQNCNDGNPEIEINMPNGRCLRSWQIVEGLHLDSWIDCYDD